MLKVGLVGLGVVAEKIHFPALESISEVQVIAACDPDAGRRDLFASKIKRIYENADLLFANENPDFVIVGAPPAHHASLSMQAMRAGADVICEKPFAASVEQADQLIEYAAANGRALAVNTQYRFMSFYEAALREIKKCSYGEPYLIQGWQQMFHPASQDKLAWRSELKKSTLFDFGSHPFDIACRMFGCLPESVTAFAPQSCQGYDSDVVMHVVLVFSGCRLATFNFNRISHAPERYFEMRVDCRDASLRLSLGGVARACLDMARNNGILTPRLRFDLIKGGEARVERLGKSMLLEAEAKIAFSKATAALIKEFIANRDTEAQRLELRFSREILNLIFAAYESVESGQSVMLRPHHSVQVQ